MASPVVAPATTASEVERERDFELNCTVDWESCSAWAGDAEIVNVKSLDGSESTETSMAAMEEEPAWRLLICSSQ